MGFTEREYNSDTATVHGMEDGVLSDSGDWRTRGEKHVSTRMSYAFQFREVWSKNVHSND